MMLGKVIQAVLHCVAEIDEDRAIHRKPEGPKVIPRAFVRLVLTTITYTDGKTTIAV